MRVVSVRRVISAIGNMPWQLSGIGPAPQGVTKTARRNSRAGVMRLWVVLVILQVLAARLGVAG